MPPDPRNALTFPTEVLREWRQDIVTRQLDDVNVLGEALVAALNENDEERAGSVRASMARYALAMGWSKDKFLPAILAYAKEQPEFDEDLFAPAFILRAIFPEYPETKTLFSRLSEDTRVLLQGSYPDRTDAP